MDESVYSSVGGGVYSLVFQSLSYRRDGRMNLYMYCSDGGGV